MEMNHLYIHKKNLGLNVEIYYSIYIYLLSMFSVKNSEMKYRSCT